MVSTLPSQNPQSAHGLNETRGAAAALCVYLQCLQFLQFPSDVSQPPLAPHPPCCYERCLKELWCSGSWRNDQHIFWHSFFFFGFTVVLQHSPRTERNTSCAHKHLSAAGIIHSTLVSLLSVCYPNWRTPKVSRKAEGLPGEGLVLSF